MSKLRRHITDNATFFVTAVTYGRTPILGRYAAVLLESLKRQTQKHGVEVCAWVILPDQFHLLLELENTPLPKFMQSVKLAFTNQLRKKGQHLGGRLWQLRYWDHVIRDQKDYNRHFDYIHYNPVKHGIVHSPFAHEMSSANKYLREGLYEKDWGEGLSFRGDYGE